MPIKFSLPTKETKRKSMVASSSGYVKNGNSGSSGRFYASTDVANTPMSRFAQSAGGVNAIMTQPMFFSPLHTPQNWQIASKRREVYQWARFYYENEAKVAAAIDFYSSFPMNGFELECKSKKVLKYFKKVVDDLGLNNLLKLISKEYFLLGDVFPFKEIDCPNCQGSGVTPEGEVCSHAGGKIKRIVILNPDWVEVQKSILASEPMIAMVPDEELRSIVQRRQPRQIYDKLPPALIEMVASGQPIPLSNRSVSHLKHNETPYGTYGISLLRRCFQILAYKTKIMTANWIVAERLILPVRVVKVGNDARPAGPDDIADVANQLANVANDPNMTLVTHHAFEYDWHGATGKIHQITQELEYIGKEILDGFMLNQSLLNGEGPAYGSAQVGIEAMIQRLESWRSTLQEWVEKNVFLPISMMQGFIDEAETKEMGEVVYLYPKLKFNDMNLRDDSNEKQMMMQLHDKKLISSRKLLDIFDIDYDQMVEEIREETTIASASGMLMQGPGGGGGGMGGMMGGMGGPPGGGGEGMGMGEGMGEMGVGMEGGMGMDGGMGGGMEGGMGAAAGGMPSLKVGRRGKGGKSPQEQAAMMMPKPKMIKLTSLEQKMLKTLLELDIPYKLFGQYQVQLQGTDRPYLIDFAYPQIGVGIEADGAMWHAREDLRQRDNERDQKLASVGWTVMRFSETEINEHLDQIKDVVYSSIVEVVKARKEKKKSSVDEDFVKTASTEGYKECSSVEEALNKQVVIDNVTYKIAYSSEGAFLYTDGFNFASDEDKKVIVENYINSIYD